MTDLLTEALSAHGGADRWEAARTVTARVRTGGLLVRTRMPGNRLADYTVTVELGRPHAILDPFPSDGERGVFDEGGARIERDGEVLDERADPRARFFGLSGLRRNLRWDALDTVYFAGYAMWNYLSFPRLLTAPGVEVSDGGEWRTDEGVWRRLEARFPASIPTHSPRQTFHLDEAGLIRRQDYTAEVVSRFAKAGHICAEHRESGGLVFPTRRRVRPIRRDGTSAARPTLVALDLSDIRVS